jgi:ribonuclease P protein component
LTSPRRLLYHFRSLLALFRAIDNETHIPARQPQTRAYARLPRAHENPRRTRGVERPSRQGPQAPDPIKRATSADVAKPSLPRAARLLTRSDFATLRQRSDRLTTRNFVAEYRASSHATARLGVAISRKVSKLAVVRNRIRRTIRESFRHHRQTLPNVDILIIARSLSANQTNPVLRSDLENLWQQLVSRKTDAALNP